MRSRTRSWNRRSQHILPGAGATVTFCSEPEAKPELVYYSGCGAGSVLILYGYGRSRPICQGSEPEPPEHFTWSRSRDSFPEPSQICTGPHPCLIHTVI